MQLVVLLDLWLALACVQAQSKILEFSLTYPHRPTERYPEISLKN